MGCTHDWEDQVKDDQMAALETYILAAAQHDRDIKTIRLTSKAVEEKAEEVAFHEGEMSGS